MIGYEDKEKLNKLFLDWKFKQEIRPETRLGHDLGIIGDDFHDFIEDFAAIFNIQVSPNIDLSRYTKPEGYTFGGLLDFTKYKNDRIDLSVKDLEDIIESGCMI